jgi:hypothetical protein
MKIKSMMFNPFYLGYRFISSLKTVYTQIKGLLPGALWSGYSLFSSILFKLTNFASSILVDLTLICKKFMELKMKEIIYKDIFYL